MTHLPDSHRQVGIAARVVVGALAGVTVYYVVAARALRFEEVRKLLQLRKRPA